MQVKKYLDVTKVFKVLNVPKLEDYIIVMLTLAQSEKFDLENLIYDNNVKVENPFIPEDILYKWDGKKYTAVFEKDANMAKILLYLKKINEKKVNSYYLSKSGLQFLNSDYYLNELTEDNIALNFLFSGSDADLNDLDDKIIKKLEKLDESLEEENFDKLNESIKKEMKEADNCEDKLNFILDNLPDINSLSDMELDDMKYFDNLDNYYYHIIKQRERNTDELIYDYYLDQEGIRSFIEKAYADKNKKDFYIINRGTGYIFALKFFVEKSGGLWEGISLMEAIKVKNKFNAKKIFCSVEKFENNIFKELIKKN